MTKRDRKPVRPLSTTQLAEVRGGNGGSESRNIEFEMIKNEIQK